MPSIGGRLDHVDCTVFAARRKLQRSRREVIHQDLKMTPFFLSDFSFCVFFAFCPILKSLIPPVRLRFVYLRCTPCFYIYMKISRFRVQIVFAWLIFNFNIILFVTFSLLSDNYIFGQSNRIITCFPFSDRFRISQKFRPAS